MAGGAADDTIVAVATPRGRSGIGVVRVSGAAARALVEAFFESPQPLRDRLARYGVFRDRDGAPLDDVIVTVFRAPASYTGEDVAEISGHGNPVVLDRIVDTLVAAGARRAEPGEFTLRAVGHGKLDLAQAEAIRDFIAAQTEAQARTAMLQKEGALARRVGPGKEALVRIVAELEAGIDFAEDDVPVPDSGDLGRRVSAVRSSLLALRDTYRYGRLLAGGLSLAVAGKPNVGKSSVFNRLLTSPGRAIVSDVPGTTRDVVTGAAAIAGVPLQLSDTAGVRDTRDPVESQGVDRTFEALAGADLTLVVLDSSRGLDNDDEVVLDRVRERPHLVVINKRDLPAKWEPGRHPGGAYVSALTGEGMEGLRSAIEDYITGSRPAGADDFVVTSQRQQEALAEACARLDAAIAGLEKNVPHEMVLLDLYAALSAVGEVTGEVTRDDILDRVFSTFCIGK